MECNDCVEPSDLLSSVRDGVVVVIDGAARSGAPALRPRRVGELKRTR